MERLKELYNSNKWIFGVWMTLVIIAIFNMFDYSFASNIIQDIYYVLYIIFTSMAIVMINRKSEFRISHLIIILINLVAIVIAVKNEFIALPLLLAYLFLGSTKSHFISIILSTFTYFIAFIWVVLLLTVGRMAFSPNEEIGRIPSPNGAYELVIISNNQGALGGATITNLDKIYLKTFKHRKWVFYDDWGVENKINWIDNKNFKIDGHIIDVDTKEVIYGDR
jgi:hypothetical protein